MYLKSLTLKGFKSFAQPTTFEFEPGVTAIVGPNGSGKSNVVDALAWVMGEQGAKTLRGGKMEDVIFAGTQHRGPLGRAEVKLTIDNSDGALPIEYTEVTISRTLFRNGTSEYAINGETCRLLDVQELLSDSGLGREMHVIVGQGQLDAVLRATPEERRGFIEEAAGILKHRRRKERTLRKLEAMETNLTRLNDLAGEIRRQLKPLGRQAEVARQAQHIAAEVRDAKSRLLADDVARLRAELSELAKDEAARHSERIVVQEQLEQKALRIARLEQEQQGDSLDTARRTTLDLERVQLKLHGLRSQVEQRLTFLASQQHDIPSTPGVSTDAIADANAEVHRLEKLIPEAESAWQRARATTEKAAAELDAIDEHIAHQSALVSQHDLKLTQLRGALDAACQTLTAREEEHERGTHRQEAAASRLGAARDALAAFEATHDDMHVPASNIEEQYHSEQQRLGEAERLRDDVRDLVHELESERSGLNATIEALVSALDVKDATAALLARSEGRVADHLTVEPGYEVAVSAAMGSFAEAILVDRADDADAILDSARNDELGRLAVFIRDAHSLTDTPRIAGATPLADVVKGPAGVLAFLVDTYVAEDLATARRLLDRAGDAAPGLTVVTRSGDVVTPHVVLGGSGTAPSRIELVAERERAERSLASVQERIRTERERLEQLSAEAATAKEHTAALLRELRDSDARRADIVAKRNQLTAQVEAAEAELERVTQHLEEARRAREAAQRDVDEARRLLEAAEATPRPMFDTGERDAAYARLEAEREREVEARLALETARERAAAQVRQRDALLAQFESEQRAADEAARREALRKRQLDQAERIAAVLPLVIAACDRSLEEARTELRAAEAERARHSQELTLLRSEEADLRSKLSHLTEHAHGVELSMYERKLQLSSLLERAGDELGLVEDVLVAEYGPDVPVPRDGDEVPYDRAEQEERLRQAEKRLSELGRINPLALEEFAALEQRHLFLTEQLEDLTQTRKDLLKIISDLDDRMEGIFADAFADTQRAFEQVFPILFPGGSGEIFLSNPDDLLTTGIEVSVRPAGKKIERLSLLSGGERSLAAVAWLIAIFQARPSPFYIMDEVEAALDDANLGRLLQVFEQLRENSQLIVITHQKRTMEIADALYGVSMRQDGVSAVVGQRVAERV